MSGFRPWYPEYLILGELSNSNALYALSYRSLLSKLRFRDQIPFLREHWTGPIVLKGIQHPEDAKLAMQAGCDGIIVSNHGGRQLDGAVGSLSMLPSIVDAVGDQMTVLFDSGVRTGADILKALCLGAKGVLVGRPIIAGYSIAGGNLLS